MNSAIKKAILDGRLVLLLGAGASITCKDSARRNLLMGNRLAELLAKEIGWEYSNESLPQVYGAAKGRYQSLVHKIFQDRYRHCLPSEEYFFLAQYSWPRIYTLNIDDGLDRAFQQESNQKIFIRSRNEGIADQDQLYNNLDIVKLNGSADRMHEGFIFSSEEYGSASSSVPLWYRQLGQDYFRYVFLFIGTKLNEPLFYHQIERYKMDSLDNYNRSYVLTPNATEIEKESLLSLNLEHISGTLEDFTEWLKANIPNPNSPMDIALKRNPGLRSMLSIKDIGAKEEYTRLFDQLTLVKRDVLEKLKSDIPLSMQRNFYKGFKPTWDDILDKIPANLEATQEFYNAIVHGIKSKQKLAVLYGAAGTGKTTMLKQVALKISENFDFPIFYIDVPVENLKEIVIELEKMDIAKYCIFYDKVDQSISEFKKLYINKIIQKGFIIGAERQRRWEVIKYDLSGFVDYDLRLHVIDHKDAKLILQKVKQFGPWTRLSKMNPDDRVRELVIKAKRQLLIGLLETTLGIGFEKIIADEFSQISNNDDEKFFFMIIGFATYHRLPINYELIMRSLSNLGIRCQTESLFHRMSGIIYRAKDRYYARHPLYVQHIFNELIDVQTLYNVLSAMIQSFTVYKKISTKEIGKAQYSLFKSLYNHKFVKRIFRSDKNLILKFYSSFEKSFERFGLYWLQYGLSLRDMDRQQEALEKLYIANEAYPQAHIEHALAQQQLIIAFEVNMQSKAYDLVGKAKETLLRLDTNREALNDEYPIVALSEGHCQIVHKYEGIEKGTELAKEYANLIEKRLKEMNNDRLKKAWIKLTTYVSSGKWVDNGCDTLVC